MNWNWAVFHVIFSGVLWRRDAPHNTLSALRASSSLGGARCGYATTFQGDYSRSSFQLYYFPFASDNNEKKKERRKKKIKIVPFHAIVNPQHLIEPSSNRLRLTKKSIFVFPTQGYQLVTPSRLESPCSLSLFLSFLLSLMRRRRK